MRQLDASDEALRRTAAVGESFQGTPCPKSDGVLRADPNAILRQESRAEKEARPQDQGRP
jgi:hypothetical protein